MYAVIETGGKQYRVEVGTVLEIERLEAEPGASISLERVLLVADGDDAAIGRPLVADATVSAEVLRQDRGEKVVSFKYRPKARRRVKKGHRQELTVLRISDITFNGRSAAEAVRASEEAAKTERERLEEAAARQAAADAALAAKLASRGAAAKEETSSAKPAARSRRGRGAAAGSKTDEGPTEAATAEAAAGESAAAEPPTEEPASEGAAAAEAATSEPSSGATGTPKPKRSTKKDG